MSAPILARLAAALALLAVSGGSASACFLLWRCEVYPPMYAPSYDPKRGPMWTPNGWSYPPAWSRVAPYEAVMEEAYGDMYPPPPPPRYVDERDARWRGYEGGRPLK
jgi:hypothetical protein